MIRHHSAWRTLLLFLLALSLVGAGFSYLAARLWTGAKITQNQPTHPKFTVVLDAGHGGEDGGAVSAEGVLEKLNTATGAWESCGDSFTMAAGDGELIRVI